MHTFSGVRPLYDDNADNPSAVTRDYIFELDATDGQAPLLSVFGGKITTFRKLSEHALEDLKPFFPKMGEGVDGERASAGRRHAPMRISTSSSATCARHIRGCRPHWQSIMRGSTERARANWSAERSSLADLGRRFGPDFYEREARLPVRDGMGGDGGGHSRAPHQARPAYERR